MKSASGQPDSPADTADASKIIGTDNNLDPKMPACKIMKREFLCGVVEGFYGRPWTTEKRKDLFSKMDVRTTKQCSLAEILCVVVFFPVSYTSKYLSYTACYTYICDTKKKTLHGTRHLTRRYRHYAQNFSY